MSHKSLARSSKRKKFQFTCCQWECGEIQLKADGKTEMLFFIAVVVNSITEENSFFLTESPHYSFKFFYYSSLTFISECIRKTPKFYILKKKSSEFTPVNLRLSVQNSHTVRSFDGA